MRSLGSMLAETYASWLHSLTTCCGSDEKPRQGEFNTWTRMSPPAPLLNWTDEKPIVVLRDQQPVPVPPPSAEPLWSNDDFYEKPLQEPSRSRGRPSSSWSRGTVGTPWFSKSSSQRRRPKISGPSNFRHLHSESFQFPQPEPVQKRFSFRPLELNFEGQDDNMSPLMPAYCGDDDADRDAQVTPPPRAHTAASSHKWDGSSSTLTHDRSYSSFSFHVPRRNGEGSISSQDPITPPRIPFKSRARAYTSPSNAMDSNLEGIVERIASGLIEKERLQAEIESIIERQSIYVNSRPGTAYGPAGMSHATQPYGNQVLTVPDLEPMPSIPALPPAAPSFAERLSTDGRPQTAPQAATSHPNEPLTPQERTLALAQAAFNSHPFRVQASASPVTHNFRDLDRPLAPPLPLVLRPPLRKKKSFSRVSNWLFPGANDDPTRRIDSVTNSPMPVRDNEGFYQVTRTSVGSDSSLSTWQTTDQEEDVPTTTWSPGSSPIVQNTPKHTPVVERAKKFESGAGLVQMPVQGPRPTSVGVAF
ncbi:hypothetical protein OQA88_13035 [Cercophora sp. LCS_1]